MVLEATKVLAVTRARNAKRIVVRIMIKDKRDSKRRVSERIKNKKQSNEVILH